MASAQLYSPHSFPLGKCHGSYFCLHFKRQPRWSENRLLTGEREAILSQPNSSFQTTLLNSAVFYFTAFSLLKENLSPCCDKQPHTEKQEHHSCVSAVLSSFVQHCYDNQVHRSALHCVGCNCKHCMSQIIVCDFCV